MKQELLGQTIEISESRVQYNKYRKRFTSEAKQAAKRFRADYQNNNRGLVNVIENTPEQIQRAMEPTIDYCIQTLVDHGILTIDQSRFEELYEDDLSLWQKPYLRICDKYAEITMEQDELDAYRVARRENRGRWVGGGFGLGGAIKGAATAGALNMVSGAAHMVVNGIGKLISSSSASSAMQKIFTDENTEKSLEDSVYDMAFRLHLCLLECLSRTDADTVPWQGRLLENEVDRAKSILNNVSRISDQEEQQFALLEAFYLNPYAQKWYAIALQEFGDADGTVESTAKYFGVTTVWREKRDNLDTFAASLPLDTEPLAQQALSKIEERKKWLSFTDETEHTKAVSKAVADFDLQYRTVDGYVFLTREEADAVKIEFAQIQEIEAATDMDSITSVESAQKQLEQYHSLVAQKHQEIMAKRWGELDKKRRSVFTNLPNVEPVLLDSPEAASAAQKTADMLTQCLESCKADSNPEAALQAMKNRVDAETLPEKVRACYAAEVQRLLHEIDLKERTAFHKEYTTRAAAASARQAYTGIDADIQAQDLRKQAATLRSRIDAADLSSTAKESLKKKLFRKEHATEIHAAQIFSGISGWILIGLILVSYLFNLSCTADFAYTQHVFFGYSFMLADITVCPHLTFLDGLKNALVVFGHCAGEIFINGFYAYIEGFGRGLIGSIIWAVVGVFWVLIKYGFLAIPRFILCTITVFFQRGSLLYYVGYLLGTGLILSILTLNQNEGDEENILRKLFGK